MLERFKGFVRLNSKGDLGCIPSEQNNNAIPIEELTKTELQKLRNAVEVQLQEIARGVGNLRFTLHFYSRAYLKRLLVVCATFLVTSLVNATCSMAAGWRNPLIIVLDAHTGEPLPGLRGKTLPDLGHDGLAWLSMRLFGTEYVDLYRLPDDFVACFGLLLFGLLVCHPRRFCIIRRLLAVSSLLNLLRAFTVIVTSLPDASPACMAQFTHEELKPGGSGSYKNEAMFPSALMRGALFVAQPTHGLVTCGDMIFSGHTVFLFLTALTFNQYCRTEEGFEVFHWFPTHFLAAFRRLLYLAAFIGVLAIVATRFHYTLDCTIAIGVTVYSWRTYHWSLDVLRAERHRRKPVVSRELCEESRISRFWVWLLSDPVLSGIEVYAWEVMQWLEAEEADSSEAMAEFERKNPGAMKWLRRPSEMDQAIGCRRWGQRGVRQIRSKSK